MLLPLSFFLLVRLACAQTSVCCSELESRYPSQTLQKSSLPDLISYQKENLAYWSATNYLDPQCIFLPSSASEIATALSILVKRKCKFAVRGGGHSPNPGFASSRDVLISTSNMKSVKVENGIAHIGPGALWGEVYEKIAAQELAVVGGKLRSVGVAGLTLGGGVSWLTGERGLACQNTDSYEIVLANSSIVTASATKNPDLFFALKGGSSSFGIVTSFRLRTYPQAKIWGARLLYLGHTIPDFFSALTNYSLHPDDSEKAKTGIVATTSTLLVDGLNIAIASIFYNEPTATPPEIWKEFLSIPHLGEGALTTLPLFAQYNDFGGVEDGGRQLYRTGAIVPDLETLKFLQSTHQEVFKNISPLSGAISTLAFQPIPASTAGMGETALDLENEQRIWWLVNIRWLWKLDDEKMYGLAREMTGRVEKWLEENGKGKGRDFRYLNEAMFDQKPFESYPSEKLERLKNVKRKVDPSGVFGKLGGGFRLDV